MAFNVWLACTSENYVVCNLISSRILTGLKMNRYVQIPLILTITFLLSLFFLINLFVVLFLIGVMIWIMEKIGIVGDNKIFIISSIFYTILGVLTLVNYVKTTRQWKEVILGILFFCFSMTSLFPLILKLFSSVEPPYLLNSIVTILISGLILIWVGQMKVKAIEK